MLASDFLKPYRETDLETKTVLFIDHGLYVHFARTVAPGFKEAYYWTPWAREFPDGNSLSVGDGYPELTRLEEWESVQDEIDLFVVLDLGFAATAERLRKAGRRVWAAGGGDRLELDRGYFRETLEALGLPVQTAQWCRGIDALEAYLQKHEDVYVKISTFRGAMETWHSANYEASSMRLVEMRHTMGGRALVTPFLVEHAIEAVAELGYDGYCIDGKFPARSAYGFEKKDAGYIGMIEEYEALPEAVRSINDAMAPVLEAARYRGMLSTEIRQTEDEVFYFTDITCRCPSPPTELTGEWYRNWPMILWEGAAGRVVDPEPVAKFGAEAMLDCERCYSFDPLANKSLPPEQAGRIMGIEGCLWGEFLSPWTSKGGWADFKTSGEVADYRTLPRLCSLAEVAWTPQERRGYADFDSRLGNGHLQRLTAAGYIFRVTPPDAVIEQDGIHIIPAVPGMEIRYTTDGTDPFKSTTAQKWAGESIQSAPAQFRARAYFQGHPGPLHTGAQPPKPD